MTGLSQISKEWIFNSRLDRKTILDNLQWIELNLNKQNKLHEQHTFYRDQLLVLNPPQPTAWQRRSHVFFDYVVPVVVIGLGAGIGIKDSMGSPAVQVKMFFIALCIMTLACALTYFFSSRSLRNLEISCDGTALLRKVTVKEGSYYKPDMASSGIRFGYVE